MPAGNDFEQDQKEDTSGLQAATSDAGPPPKTPGQMDREERRLQRVQAATRRTEEEHRAALEQLRADHQRETEEQRRAVQESQAELETRLKEIELLKEALAEEKSKREPEPTPESSEPTPKNWNLSFRHTFKCVTLEPTRKRYYVWKFRMKGWLSQHGNAKHNMWTDVIDNPPTQENKRDLTWIKLNDDAKLILAQYISDSLVAECQRYDYAHDWWIQLAPDNSTEAADLSIQEMKSKSLRDFRSLDDYLAYMEEMFGYITSCDGGRNLLDNNTYLFAVLNGVKDNHTYARARSQMFEIYDRERKIHNDGSSQDSQSIRTTQQQQPQKPATKRTSSVGTATEQEQEQEQEQEGPEQKQEGLD